MIILIFKNGSTENDFKQNKYQNVLKTCNNIFQFIKFFNHFCFFYFLSCIYTI